LRARSIASGCGTVGRFRAIGPLRGRFDRIWDVTPGGIGIELMIGKALLVQGGAFPVQLGLGPLLTRLLLGNPGLALGNAGTLSAHVGPLAMLLGGLGASRLKLALLVTQPLALAGAGYDDRQQDHS
jgi:hypothetical protein